MFFFPFFTTFSKFCEPRLEVTLLLNVLLIYLFIILVLPTPELPKRIILTSTSFFDDFTFFFNNY